MRDLETAHLRTLPERLALAQRNALVSDDQLCDLMGWERADLESVRSGARPPTPAEMRALYGVFGKGSQGLLKTRYRKGAFPPRKAADWVLIGRRGAESGADRLRSENQALRDRLAEAEREIAGLNAELRQLEKLARRLERAL